MNTPKQSVTKCWLLGTVTLGLFCATATATAQTFTTLKSFGNLTNVTGINPQSKLVQGLDGTLYGTTSSAEGNVRGTVFKLQPDGTGFAVLKWFTNAVEGLAPASGLTLSGSVLYGTTTYGGTSEAGTVFKMNTDGTGYTVIRHFAGAGLDGVHPFAGLTLSGGVLYGTTVDGGTLYWGTVFKLNTDGTGYTVLKNFAYGTERSPFSELTYFDGVLYGTAAYGGISNSGAIFKLNTNGTGYTVLKEFAGTNGAYPFVGLTLSGGALFGTSYYGGVSNAGTLFKLNTDGTGFTVLKHCASSDGRGPSGLTLSGSVLYGTTYSGGSSDAGTLFTLNTDGTDYAVLKHFTGSDGAAPSLGGLTLSGSTLYGATYDGGSSGVGTVFKLNTNGTGHSVLKHFGYSDAAHPRAGLVLFSNELYGTTYFEGGGSGLGTVFKVSANGSGYTVLKDFTGSDGAEPASDLTLSGSVLYGTTQSGGSSNRGTVFKLNTDGSGFTVLKHFAGSDGSGPSGLVLSGNELYGTTYGGGNSNLGTVFKINTNGSGYTVLKEFAGNDGAWPGAELTFSGSVLYGTTYGGGTSDVGTIFKLNIDGTGFTVLKHCTDSDGAYPEAGLALSGDVLYGTASYGGTWTSAGTVFKLNTDGSGFTVLKNFNGSNGSGPAGGLTLTGSVLYGTTYGGGSSSSGTIFKMNTDGSGFRVLRHFNGDDGAEPSAVLTLSNQALYGTTFRGGDLDVGTVFKLDLSDVPLPVVRYVNVNSTDPTPPFTNWTTAAVTIQDAIDAALPDDEILVTNGVYQTGGRSVVPVDGTTNRVEVDKPVAVRSVNGPQFTLIQGYQVPGTTNGPEAIRCVYLAEGATLSGFTLTNGATVDGGGLGGGVAGDLLAGGILKNCMLINNASGYGGGGASGCLLRNCVLAGNTAFYEGGGAYYSMLDGCTLIGNMAPSGGGVNVGMLNNCTVYYNTSQDGANYSPGVTLNSCCTTPLPGNGVGSITNVPLFVDTNGWANLRLQSNSPCINAGNNDYVVGSTDWDGRPRIVAGMVDIGAYEFQPGVSGEFIGWLPSYGLPTDGSVDYADLDADNMNNWQEWIAGTIPTDAASTLRILNLTSDSSGITVSWQSVSNRAYFLERAVDLGAQPPFSLVTNNIAGQPGTTSHTDSNDIGNGPYFYRVGVQQ